MNNAQDSEVRRLLEKHAHGRELPEFNRELEIEERGRLLQHAAHEEGIFYNRLNFFLVCESLLVGAIVTTYGATNRLPHSFVVTASLIGASLTGLWFYAQYNKLLLMKVVEARLYDHLQEFRETITLLRFVRQRRGSANTLLAFSLPLLFAVAWTCIGIWL